MIVKLCGFKKLEDIERCFSLGVDFIGLNHIKSSKRYLEKNDLLDLFAKIKEKRKIVLLVDNYDEDLLKELKNMGLCYVQSYLNEDGDKKLKKLDLKIFKVIRVAKEEDLSALRTIDDSLYELILLDTKTKGQLGGSAESFDWQLYRLAKDLSPCDLGLAGGLKLSNLAEALKVTETSFIDLASGAEDEYANKDFDKIEKILGILKGKKF